MDNITLQVQVISKWGSIKVSHGMTDKKLPLKDKILSNKQPMV